MGGQTDTPDPPRVTGVGCGLGCLLGAVLGAAVGPFLWPLWIHLATTLPDVSLFQTVDTDELLVLYTGPLGAILGAIVGAVFERHRVRSARHSDGTDRMSANVGCLLGGVLGGIVGFLAMAAFRVIGFYLVFMLPRGEPLDVRQIDEAIPIVIFGALGGLIGAPLGGLGVRSYLRRAATGASAEGDRPAGARGGEDIARKANVGCLLGGLFGAVAGFVGCPVGWVLCLYLVSSLVGLPMPPIRPLELPLVVVGPLGAVIGAWLLGPATRRWVLEGAADAPTGGGASDDSGSA